MNYWPFENELLRLKVKKNFLGFFLTVTYGSTVGPRPRSSSTEEKPAGPIPRRQPISEVEDDNNFYICFPVYSKRNGRPRVLVDSNTGEWKSQRSRPSSPTMNSRPSFVFVLQIGDEALWGFVLDGYGVTQIVYDPYWIPSPVGETRSQWIMYPSPINTVDGVLTPTLLI